MALYGAQASEIVVAAANGGDTLLNWRQNGRTFELRRFTVSFNGTTAADEPFLVEVCNQGQTGTKSDVTEYSLDTGNDALDATAHHTYTVEPTTNGVIQSFYLTPNGGTYSEAYVPGEGPIAQNGEAIGIKITSSSGATTCDASVSMVIDE